MTVSPRQDTVAESVVTPGFLRALRRDPLAAVATFVIVVFGVVAVLQPLVMPFPAERVNLSLTNAPPFTTEYILGGDKYGRDILSRIIAGTRGAWVAGLVLTGVALALGVTLGLVAGYFRGLIESATMWLFSVLIAVPGIILLIALYTVTGASTTVAVAVLGVLQAPSVYLLVRTLTIRVRNELYVDAARVAGLSAVRIIARHVLLAVRGPVIVLAAFLFAGAMAATAGLEFLGLGNRLEPTWGGMLNDAFTNYYTAPWQLVWPGLALGMTMAAFVLLGNSIRDRAENTQVKPSARARRRRVEQLFGDAAAHRTIGAVVEPPPNAPGDVVRAKHGRGALLDVTDLRIAYGNGGVAKDVVRSASFSVQPGEVVGLVGESGSGKTQTVLSVLGLLPDDAVIVDGSIVLAGTELIGLADARFTKLRGRRLAYVPQEPMSNLDPSSKVGAQLVDGIRARGSVSRADAKAIALEMLARVGIRDPLRTFDAYPFQISGGMAQRVLIAGAVASRPALLIADEPTTALDVTVQAEVLDLLRALKDEFSLAVLIVTHNFGVVADFCDRVVVMKEGEVVETGGVIEVFHDPQHPYTRMLLASILDDAPRRDQVDAERSSSEEAAGFAAEEEGDDSGPV